MRITKKQLLRIIRENLRLDEKNKGLWANIHAKRKRGEKPAKKGDEDYPDEKSWKSAQEDDHTEGEALDEQSRTPTPDQMMQVEFDDDFHQLIASLEDAVVAAREMGKKMQNVEYSQWAGGREANDVERLLGFIWQEFGGRSLSAEGFDE